MNIETLLENELQSELKALGEIEELGTETYKTTVDGIVKLMDRKLELDRLKAEAAEKETAREEAKRIRELEQEFKVKQQNRDDILKIVGHGLTLLTLVVHTRLTVWGTNKTLKFEETGTVTTTAGRGFMNRLFGKK